MSVQIRNAPLASYEGKEGKSTQSIKRTQKFFSLLATLQAEANVITSTVCFQLALETAIITFTLAVIYLSGKIWFRYVSM